MLSRTNWARKQSHASINVGLNFGLRNSANLTRREWTRFWVRKFVFTQKINTHYVDSAHCLRLRVFGLTGGYRSEYRSQPKAGPRCAEMAFNLQLFTMLCLVAYAICMRDQNTLGRAFDAAIKARHRNWRRSDWSLNPGPPGHWTHLDPARAWPPRSVLAICLLKFHLAWYDRSKPVVNKTGGRPPNSLGGVADVTRKRWRGNPKPE